MFSFLLIRTAVLITGSVNSDIARVVKQGSAEFNFYIGRNIVLFGYHIHHFYFGIFLIAIAGWLSLSGFSRLSREKLAIIYGLGLGLLMDEIGLLLTWGHYFSSLTYLLSIFLMGIFLNVIYFSRFWQEVRKELVIKKPDHLFKSPVFQHNSLIKVVDDVSDKFENTRVSSLISI